MLNVLRHWVDQHFYDFTREDVLARQLMNFFKRIQKNRTAKKWVENIEKLVSKRVCVYIYILYIMKIHPELRAREGPKPQDRFRPYLGLISCEY